MNRYFSFQRMITASFVRGFYFLGFLVLTSGSIALIVWSGLQLRQATIERTLGWQYVAIGVGALIAGNLVWRVFCELWIVLFNIHDRLTLIDEGLTIESGENFPLLSAPVKARPLAPPVKESQTFEASPHSAGVLGLS